MNKIPNNNEVYDQIMSKDERNPEELKKVEGFSRSRLDMPEIEKPETESSLTSILNVGLRIEQARNETKTNVYLQSQHYKAIKARADAKLEYDEAVITAALNAELEKLSLAVEAARSTVRQSNYLHELRRISKEIDKIRDGDDSDLVKKLAIDMLSDELQYLNERRSQYRQAQ